MKTVLSIRQSHSGILSQFFKRPQAATYLCPVRDLQSPSRGNAKSRDNLEFLEIMKSTRTFGPSLLLIRERRLGSLRFRPFDYTGVGKDERTTIGAAHPIQLVDEARPILAKYPLCCWSWHKRTIKGHRNGAHLPKIKIITWKHSRHELIDSSIVVGRLLMNHNFRIFLPTKCRKIAASPYWNNLVQ